MLIKYKRTVTPNNTLIVLLKSTFRLGFNKTIKMLFGVTVLLYFIKILGGSRNYKNMLMMLMQYTYSKCAEQTLLPLQQ